jgi:hypothetical protein
LGIGPSSAFISFRRCTTIRALVSRVRAIHRIGCASRKKAGHKSPPTELSRGPQSSAVESVARISVVHLEKVRLIAEVASYPRVSLSPRLKAGNDGGQQTCFLRRPFQSGCLAEESRAQTGVPADVVSAAHLVLKKPASSRHWAPAASMIAPSLRRLVSNTKCSKTSPSVAGVARATAECVETRA